VPPLYSHPSQFEPLFPAEPLPERLTSLAHELQKECWQLSGQASPSILAALRPLLRAMNSYYTNKIEGQHTEPADIERALNRDYAADAERARRQRLALAHIETEQWAEMALAAGGWRGTFAVESVAALHRELYGRLPENERITDEGDPLEPGAWRRVDVRVGGHVAPEAGAIETFLERWSSRYGRLPEGEQALIGIACAHHRLAWIHPFRDGNGRVARLQSHLALHAMGLTNGVWSPMRGLARRHADYYAALASADRPRDGDLDGRGHLSQEGLIDFAAFFLEICLDQARFMRGLLSLDGMKDRIAELLAVESNKPGSELRGEALQPLHYCFMAGPLERGTFKAMAGLSPRTADRLLAALLKARLLVSETPKGPVSFGVPQWALRHYFPRLWPEAEGSAD
jgi:Fic family protein